ncbi:hypothetical protein ACWD0J_40340 [Streptomyces sp. NPDC003011]
MGRYVHDEVRAAIAAAAALSVTAAVLCAVRGFPELSGRWWLPHAVLIAVVALWTPVKASRLRWVGRARAYEAAVPLADPPAGGDSLRRRPVRLTVFAGFLAAALAVSLLWEPALTLLLGWRALSWLTESLVAARWERRHGVLLWQGHDEDDPWKLACSPVSPTPPTRTATGAPPG